MGVQWLRVQYEPEDTEIWSVPIGAIARDWERASILRRDQLPPCALTDPNGFGNPAFAFQHEGDFSRDGVMDRAAVGVYRKHDGSDGQFFLILEEFEPGVWRRAFLGEMPGDRGFSVLTYDGGLLEWAACLSCGGSVGIMWNRDHYWGTDFGDSGGEEWEQDTPEPPDSLFQSDVRALLGYRARGPLPANAQAVATWSLDGFDPPTISGSRYRASHWYYYGRPLLLMDELEQDKDDREAAATVLGVLALPSWGNDEELTWQTCAVDGESDPAVVAVVSIPAGERTGPARMAWRIDPLTRSFDAVDAAVVSCGRRN